MQKTEKMEYRFMILLAEYKNVYLLMKQDCLI